MAAYDPDNVGSGPSWFACLALILAVGLIALALNIAGVI